ncbi:hypothetical protein [Rhodocista pekingensis]|uniref:Uncharacterized protein n=1 Tax=Rhodocista pekingensis TaxID=201185 RepID=A0ABW2KRK7_9PROT
MGVTQSLESVAKLALEVTKGGLPLGPGALSVNDDGIVEIRRPPPASRHHFRLDGLLFHVSVTPDADRTLFQIWAEIGYLPYSIEAPEKRQTLFTLLRATSHLRKARFVVDEKQKILVLGQRELPGHMTLTDLMYEAVQFLQEARPYLRVFGQYL